MLEIQEGCPSGSTFFEPWNIMCSKRCAKPVRPGRSFLEPTWYQRLTWTIGSFRSTCRMTCRPLGSVYFSNSTFGTAPAAAAGGAGLAGAAGLPAVCAKAATDVARAAKARTHLLRFKTHSFRRTGTRPLGFSQEIRMERPRVLAPGAG